MNSELACLLGKLLVEAMPTPVLVWHSVLRIQSNLRKM